MAVVVIGCDTIPNVGNFPALLLVNQLDFSPYSDMPARYGCGEGNYTLLCLLLELLFLFLCSAVNLIVLHLFCCRWGKWSSVGGHLLILLLLHSDTKGTWMRSHLGFSCWCVIKIRVENNFNPNSHTHAEYILILIWVGLNSCAAAGVNLSHAASHRVHQLQGGTWHASWVWWCWLRVAPLRVAGW